MNNNSIQIDRYLQNEMDASEKAAFESRLAVDKELQQELALQQQIINAATNAGIKQEFHKVIRRKIIVRKLVRWSAVVIAAAVLIFFVTKLTRHEYKVAEKENNRSEKFEINAATDTIIETKAGVVFAIPAHAFNTNNNSVQLEIKTALDATAIMENGLSTMSNNDLLQTAGMFYINGYADGKALQLTKDISVSVPAQTINPNMQLFDGIDDGKGGINWVNPKPIDRSLRTYDVTTLDFYPPRYIPALKALQKDYRNKKYTDSLYYSFSAYGRAVLNKGDTVSVEGNINSEYILEDSFKKQVAATKNPAPVIAINWRGPSAEVLDYNEGNFDQQPETDTGKTIKPSLDKKLFGEESYTYYQLDPALIHAIWDKKYNNTIIATKEFEERLKYMHGLCTNEYLKIYLESLNSPLYSIDLHCANRASGETQKKFLEFAARQDGGVMLATGMQQKLNTYFEQKYKAYREAAEKTWIKYQNTLDSLNTIADIKRREQLLDDFKRNNSNFKEELCSNLHDAYRQMGKPYDCNGTPPSPPAETYYNVQVNTTGWKNLDAYVLEATTNRTSMTYTDPNTGATAKIIYSEVNITVEKEAGYDRVLVYLVPDSLTSFQRVNKVGTVFKEQLNGLFRYDAIVLAYKGQQAYFFKQENLKPQPYNFSPEAINAAALQIELSRYNLNKTNALKKDANYQLFEQQEAMRQTQLLKDMEFREKIAASIFNCEGEGERK